VPSAPRGQYEPSIAINPRDPNNLIVGLIDDSSYINLAVCSSTDGGKTWKRQLLPDHPSGHQLDFSTDPSVGFLSNGTAIYVRGDQNDFPSYFNRISCYRSTDKGETWQFLSDAFAYYGNQDTTTDKYYLTIDPIDDQLYLAWVEQHEPGYSQIAFTHSSDSGKTWALRQIISDFGHYTSPIPFADGLVAYDRYYGLNGIMIASANYSQQRVADYKPLGPYFPADSTGYPNIGPQDSALGVNSFPSVAVNQHLPSKNYGREYVIWCGKSNDGEPHLWLSTRDTSISWTLPRVIESDGITNAHSRFFPWIAIDQTNGHIAIAYYVATMLGIGSKQMLQVALFLARSKDDGATFKTRQISSLWFDPITGQDARLFSSGDVQFFGDYIGLAGMNGMWHPVWCDARSGDAEIYTATIPDSVFDQNSEVVIEPARNGLTLSFSRQPATARMQCSAIVTSNHASAVELRLYDEIGRMLGAPIVDDRLAREHELRFTPARAGVVFYTLREYVPNGEREIVGRLGVVER